DHHDRARHQHRAGRGRPGPPPEQVARGPALDLRPDDAEPVRRGHDRVRLRTEGTAQQLAVLVGGLGHDIFSRTERRAAMPRAVWLFTAPLLMPMAWAISASDRSP